MSIPSRHHSAPGTYFVTSRTWQSRLLFATEPCCNLFLESLLHYRDTGVYLLHSFVLMPDHFHVLLTLAQGKTLERAVQFIKGGSARKLALERHMHFPVWQRGFSDHRIRDVEDFAGHNRYIEQNPVRKKFVSDARDFRWSSASGTFTMDAQPQGLKPREQGAALRHG
jgi:putative transposase